MATDKPRPKHGQHAYTDGETEVQKREALQYFIEGDDWTTIAEKIGVSSRDTAQRRVNSMLDEFAVHANYEQYRACQLVQSQAMAQKLRKLIHDWDPIALKWMTVSLGNGLGSEIQGKEVSNIPELISMIGELRKLLEFEMKLTGTARAPIPGDGDDYTGMDAAALTDVVVSMWKEQLDERQIMDIIEQLEEAADL